MPEESIDVITNVGSGADDKEEMRNRLSEIFAASGRSARISLARSGEKVVELWRCGDLRLVEDSNVARASVSCNAFDFLGIASLVLLVGFSRIYLGAHYLSDVLGAMMEGLAWLALCLTAVNTTWRVRHREKPSARGS